MKSNREDVNRHAQKLYLSLFKNLYAIAYGILECVHLSYDAVQNTFMKWMELHPTDRAGILFPKGYLMIMVRNEALRIKKDQSRYGTLEEYNWDERHSLDLVTHLFKEASTSELVHFLLSMLEQKYPKPKYKYAIVLRLYYLSNLTHQEIADQLGITAGNSRVILKRAIFKCAEIYVELYPEDDPDGKGKGRPKWFKKRNSRNNNDQPNSPGPDRFTARICDSEDFGDTDTRLFIEKDQFHLEIQKGHIALQTFLGDNEIRVSAFLSSKEERLLSLINDYCAGEKLILNRKGSDFLRDEDENIVGQDQEECNTVILNKQKIMSISRDNIHKWGHDKPVLCIGFGGPGTRVVEQLRKGVVNLINNKDEPRKGIGEFFERYAVPVFQFNKLMNLVSGSFLSIDEFVSDQKPGLRYLRRQQENLVRRKENYQLQSPPRFYSLKCSDFSSYDDDFIIELKWKERKSKAERKSGMNLGISTDPFGFFEWHRRSVLSKISNKQQIRSIGWPKELQQWYKNRKELALKSYPETIPLSEQDYSRFQHSRREDMHSLWSLLERNFTQNRKNQYVEWEDRPSYPDASFLENEGDAIRLGLWSTSISQCNRPIPLRDDVELKQDILNVFSRTLIPFVVNSIDKSATDDSTGTVVGPWVKHFTIERLGRTDQGGVSSDMIIMGFPNQSDRWIEISRAYLGIPLAFNQLDQFEYCNTSPGQTFRGITTCKPTYLDLVYQQWESKGGASYFRRLGIADRVFLRLLVNWKDKEADPIENQHSEIRSNAVESLPLCQDKSHNDLATYNYKIRYNYSYQTYPNLYLGVRLTRPIFKRREMVLSVDINLSPLEREGKQDTISSNEDFYWSERNMIRRGIRKHHVMPIKQGENHKTYLYLKITKKPESRYRKEAVQVGKNKTKHGAIVKRELDNRQVGIGGGFWMVTPTDGATVC